MTPEERLIEIFFDIQRGLPRQGPGSDASTLKALSLCRDLPDRPQILDIGSGPGMQTLALARATNGNIVAVDTAREYLEELQSRAKAEKLSDKIEARNENMNALSAKPESFDLILSEGAAYIMGFGNALAAWKKFLKGGGYLAVSELIWLTPNPPLEAADFFNEGYPEMTDAAAVAAKFDENGYELCGNFVLPDSDWWDHYYTPLEAKFPALAEKYKNDAAALEVLESTRQEIGIRKRYPDAYGYAFFVGRIPSR